MEGLRRRPPGGPRGGYGREEGERLEEAQRRTFHAVSLILKARLRPSRGRPKMGHDPAGIVRVPGVFRFCKRKATVSPGLPPAAPGRACPRCSSSSRSWSWPPSACWSPCPVSASRPRLAGCEKNLMQIGIALALYDQRTGQLPPVAPLGTDPAARLRVRSGRFWTSWLSRTSRTFGTRRRRPRRPVIWHRANGRSAGSSVRATGMPPRGCFPPRSATARPPEMPPTAAMDRSHPGARSDSPTSRRATAQAIPPPLPNDFSATDATGVLPR